MELKPTPIYGLYVLKPRTVPIIIGGKPASPFAGVGHRKGPGQRDPYGWRTHNPPPSSSSTSLSLGKQSLADRLRVSRIMAAIERRARSCRILPGVQSKPKFKPFYGRYSNLGGPPMHLHAYVNEERSGDLFFSKLVTPGSPTVGGEGASCYKEEEGVVERPSSLVFTIRKGPRKAQQEEDEPRKSKYFVGPRDVLGGRPDAEIKEALRAQGLLSEEKGRFSFAWCHNFTGSQNVAISRGKGLSVKMYPPLTMPSDDSPPRPTVPTSRRSGRALRAPKSFRFAVSKVPDGRPVVRSIRERTWNGLFLVTTLMTEEQLMASKNGEELLDRFNKLGV